MSWILINSNRKLNNINYSLKTKVIISKHLPIVKNKGMQPQKIINKQLNVWVGTNELRTKDEFMHEQVGSPSNSTDH